MTTETYQPPRASRDCRSWAWWRPWWGWLAASASDVGPDRFFQAYLVAYLFWLGVALGSMALLMIQHLSGGAWGVVIRRLLEAAARTLPVMAVLFVPIILGHARPLSLDACRRARPTR